jgi:1-deoxy-D-xylulose-5-phosphate reductoisomerase
VLNAADEVAVAAFLDERIPFTGIAAVIERVLAEMPAQPVGHFDDLFDADAEARKRSEERVRGLTPA